MTAQRITAMIGKELRGFRDSPGAVLPVAIVILICLALPFLVVVGIPRLMGESLGSDRSLRQIVALAAHSAPALAMLSPDAAVQAFLFQQFLLLFLMAPIIGAVSLAAHSVVGEKQG